MKRKKILYIIAAIIIIGILVLLREKPKDIQQPQAGKEAQQAKVDKGKTKDGKDGDKKVDANQPAQADANDKAQDPNDADQIVNLKNVGMDKVIATIEEWTGKPIICSDDKLMKQKLTIYYSKKMSKEKALGLIYTAMQLKGMIAEETDEIVYIKPLSQAKLGIVPTVSVEMPLSKLENKSQIIEKYFKLNHYSPSKMQQVIAPMVAEYSHITADETTGKIAVIETVETLLRVEEVIRQFDQPSSNLVVRKVFELEDGDPAEIVQMLNMLFQGGGRKNKGHGQAKAEKGKATSVIIEAGESTIVMVPDQKRKWIIVRAKASDMEQISEWIKKFDSPDTASAQFTTVINLNYVDAREVARAVQDALRSRPGSKMKVNVDIKPLPATKQLLVSGNDDNREMVEKLVAEIDIPSTGLLETMHFEIKNADPEDIKTYIEELYGVEKKRAMPYWRRGRRNQVTADTVHIIAFPILKQITVTASPLNLEKISKQIKGWDVPPDLKDDQYRILALRNSDPVKMVDLLDKLFTEDGDRRNKSWMDYVFGNSDDKKKIVGSLHGAVTFEAVPETKKIIVISKIQEAYPIIETLIKALDKEENAELPIVVTLKYADAENLCEQLNGILNQTGTTSTIRRSTRGLEYSVSEDDSDSSNSTNGQQNTAKADMITPWWNRAREDLNRMPTSNLIGKIRFIPVQRSKAILVLSPPEYQDAIKAIVKELDKPGKQVMVKAVIVQINHSDVTSLGLQLASSPSAFGTLSENALIAFGELTRLETRGATTLSAEVGVNAFVDFLIKNSRAKILNQPTLWTKDNEEAIFFNGQRVGFVTNLFDSEEGTQSKETVEYRRVGVTLQIRPNITPEKAVDLTINLGLSRVEPELINSQLATSELETTTHLIVEDGQTIMLGGILFQADSEIERKIPLLGDLPLIGGAFRHYDNEIANNELIAFITPYVIDAETKPETVKMLEDAIEKKKSITSHFDEVADFNSN